MQYNFISFYNSYYLRFSVHPDDGYVDIAVHSIYTIYRVTQKKRELLKNPTKIEEIQEKKLLTEIEPLQLAF